jgi:hypothetical protein
MIILGFFIFDRDKENVPDASVIVPALEPLAIIEAPSRGCPSEKTTPVRVCC